VTTYESLTFLFHLGLSQLTLQQREEEVVDAVSDPLSPVQLASQFADQWSRKYTITLAFRRINSCCRVFRISPLKCHARPSLVNSNANDPAKRAIPTQTQPVRIFIISLMK